MKMQALAGAVLAGAMLATAAAQDAPPRADDPFRGLEEAGRPETEAFYRGESAGARAALDRIAGRAGMLARIRALSES